MKKGCFTGNSHPSQRNKGLADTCTANTSHTWASSFFRFKGSCEILLWNNPNKAVEFSYPPAIHVVLLRNEKRVVSVEFGRAAATLLRGLHGRFCWVASLLTLSYDLLMPLTRLLSFKKPSRGGKQTFSFCHLPVYTVNLPHLRPLLHREVFYFALFF